MIGLLLVAILLFVCFVVSLVEFVSISSGPPYADHPDYDPAWRP